jgi:DNA-binding transcriptional MerR regulator
VQGKARDGERAQWFGPGETAQRLGVTTKALRVYEREGLVVPHRAPSGWRFYGPAQLARLHQIIVLRDLGLPLRSIRTLVGSQSRLRDVLRLQRESLQAQQAKIERALALIERAQHQLEGGLDLSLDDLATLTRETVVQQSASIKEFTDRFQTLVAERDPTGQTSRAIAEMKAAVRSAKLDEGLAPEAKAIWAEAKRLNEIGDIDSEAAKQVVRRMQSLRGEAERPPQAQVDLMRGVYAEVLAEMEARSEPLPFDLATLNFIRDVTRGMKARGELD